MSEDIKELVKRLKRTVYRSDWDDTIVYANPDGVAAADALEAMAGEVETLQMKLAACGAGALANTERTVAQRITKESPYWSASLGDVYHIVDKEMEARAERNRLKAEVERLKRMLFPYAEDKEISGVTWNGFYLIGNKKSIDEFKRLENRAAQLETYRAEFVRRNEAAEAERDRLAGEVERWEKSHEALQDKFDSMRTCACQYDSSDDVCMAHSPALKAAEAERDRLKAAITTHVAGCVACGGSGVVFLCPERDDTAEAVREDCEECVGLRKALGGGE